MVLKIKPIPQVVSDNQDLVKEEFCAENSMIVMPEWAKGIKEHEIAKTDTSALTHVLIYLYPGNPVT